MWKNYLSFSRGQRIGIIVLIVLILAVIALHFVLPSFFKSEEYTDNSFLTEAQAFRSTLQSLDSLRQVERERRYEEQHQQQFPQREREPAPSYNLFAFDPNKADSATFIKLGLKSWTVSAILNYRRKGGQFRSAGDFAKIYSVTPEKFTELKPYITIEATTKEIAKDTTHLQPASVTIVVELNSADTTELMRIKGIGRGYARSIVRFRNETGGFVSVEQLQEIYGMRPENYERIRPFCSVDTSLVQKIKVNTASVEHLNRHPYLNFYQSKAIYELRRKKEKLKSLDELKTLKDFTPETLEKIQPYLNFE